MKESTAELWFEPQSVRRFCDSGAWTRGTDLMRQQQVVSLTIEQARASWLLEGEVQGSERLPYEVSVEIKINAAKQVTFWQSDCSCPVGEDCKHGVALTLAATSAHIASSKTANPVRRKSALTKTQVAALELRHQEAAQRMQELARAQEQTKLLQWLAQLYDAKHGFSTATDLPLPGSWDKEPEQFIYLLKVHNGAGPKPMLHLQAYTSRQKSSGEWSKPKPIRYLPSATSSLYQEASVADQDTLDLLRTMPAQWDGLPRYDNTAPALVQGRFGLMLLERAAATERLFTHDSKGGAAGVGVAVQWGEPIALEWQWQEHANTAGGNSGASSNSSNSTWKLHAKLHGSDAKLCHNTPLLYLDTVAGRCGVVETAGINPAQLEVLLNAPALETQTLQSHHAAVLERLDNLPIPPVLEALPRLSGITPSSHLHISAVPADARAALGLLQIQLRFDYAGYRGWWTGAGGSVVVDGAKGRALLQRNLEVEFAATTDLLDFGLHPAPDGVFYLQGAQHQHTWLSWADSDFAILREAGYEVSLDASLQQWITHAEHLDVRLTPQHSTSANGSTADTSTSPWFDLSLGIEINGERHNILPLLPGLFEAAARSPLDAQTGQPDLPPFVYLPNVQLPQGQQGFIRLPTESLKPWLGALLDLVGQSDYDLAQPSLRLSRLDAMRTAAALGDGVVWDGAQALHDMVQGLRGNQALPVVDVPSGVHATLRPYQQLGLNWLQFLRTHQLGGILADDMGLGKTLQTLAHIQVEKDAGRLTLPALIIAPVSLMGNWRSEAARFCPDLRTLVLHGKERHAVAHSMAEHDVVIAPYSLLQRDKERWLDAEWHIVVLDEAHNIKNTSTHAAQVAAQLQTRHRLCLTGTPMENHLGELWSLFHSLMPGFLGSQTRFKELFRTPIEKFGDSKRLAELRARITPFMLRRTKDLVATELPPKVETIERVALEGKQADLYETIRLGMEKTVREALSTKGLAKSQITILDALLKLRQVCCHPQLLQLPAAKKVTGSAKLEQLMELVPQMVDEGRRILLFSQFTSMLALIEVELQQRGIAYAKLTGQSRNREAIIAQFTSGAVPIFLISLKAGGVGLNLPQADTVIHYDPWWNPAVEAQATDRAHRIGQSHTVFVYKLVAQGTIEERILALQTRKADLAQSMYHQAAERKQPLFTESDISELLKPLGS